jgi:predicted nucleotidyltransferase
VIGLGLKEHFDRLAKDLLEACREHYGDRLVSLALYGSAGRGTQGPESDLDVLIVAEGLPRGRLARIQDFSPVEAALAPRLAEMRSCGLVTEVSPVFKTPEEVAAGSAGMPAAPGQDSSQYSVLVNFDTALEAGTLVHVQTSDGESVLTFAPAKTFQSIVFSAPELVKDESYDVYTGGSLDGTAADGLYADGVYTPGTKQASLVISDIVTMVGNVRGPGGMRPGGGFPPGGEGQPPEGGFPPGEGGQPPDGAGQPPGQGGAPPGG